MPEILLQDLRLGWRQLGRAPGFAAAGVVTLALGIGATTAIFSVVRAVLLRPLPYADPERLVLVWNRMERSDFQHVPVAAPDVAEYRRQARTLEAVAATNNVSEVALTGAGEPEQIAVALVTGNFFSVLGVAPVLGRDFSPGEDLPVADGAPAPAPLILSNGFWRRRFAGDRAILGRTLQIGGMPAIVVGVMPAGFRLLMPPDAGMPTAIDAWQPLRMDLAAGARDQQFLRVVARLAVGATVEQTRAEMAAIAARQRRDFTFHRQMGMQIVVHPMHRDVVGHVRPILLALFGAVLFVLLIACANVANLLLARAAGRRREMAVRGALGAGRLRLARMVMTEGLLMALCGGTGGVVLSLVGVRLLQVLQPPDMPRLEEVAVDLPVLGFALIVTVAVALLFALAPALASARRSPQEALQERGGGGGGERLRGGLVVAEVALALVLLFGAGLSLRSFLAQSRIQPGFQPRGVLTVSLSLPFSRYGRRVERTSFFRRLQEEVAALPGVEAVGAVFPLPLSGRFWTGPYGRPEDGPDEWAAHDGNFRPTTAGYFEAMGIPLLRGRTFTSADGEEGREVAVVDRAMAALMWPGEDPVGRRLGIDLFGSPHRLEVVGVVESVRHQGLTGKERETVYFPHHLYPWAQMNLAVRSAGTRAGLLGSIRERVRRMDPDLPLYDPRPMEGYLQDATAGIRFTLVLAAVFAATAVLLAAIGLYGVVSYTVARQSREIGIRMAMGALPRQILQRVLGRGLLMAGGGILIGLLVALPSGRLVARALYGVSATDAEFLVALPLLLVTVAAVASLLPAWRAARVDPMQTLREE